MKNRQHSPTVCIVTYCIRKAKTCLLDYSKKQTIKQKSPPKSIHKLDPIHFVVDYRYNNKSQEHTQTKPSKLGCGL